MSQWKNTDDAANSVSWVARYLGMGSGKAAQVANNTALFGNTTAGAFTPNQTIGTKRHHSRRLRPQEDWLRRSCRSSNLRDPRRDGYDDR